MLHGTRKPLRLWFRAMFQMVGQKSGLSALNFKRLMGMASYQTAWTWLHKLRRAMVRPDRPKLDGTVEVDETFVGGVVEGCAGRAVAVEIVAKGERPASGRQIPKEIIGPSPASAAAFEHPMLMLGQRHGRHGHRVRA